jgi:hypothetical protein
MTWSPLRTIAVLTIVMFMNAGCQSGSSVAATRLPSRTPDSTAAAATLATLATLPTSQATPTPSPGATATVESTATPAALAHLPRELEHYWVGETRTIPGLEPAAVMSVMKYETDQLVFYASEDWDHPIVSSVAKVDGDGHLRLTLDADSVSCSSGEVGTYDYDLSPTKRALDLTAIGDPCAARVAAISGSWTLSACPEDHLCFGELDDGPHASVIYTPFVRFDDWRYDYGRFTYAVPDRWTNPEDNPDGYVLVSVDAPDGTGIYVFSDVLAHEQAVDPVSRHCISKPASSVGSSAVEMHDWLPGWSRGDGGPGRRQVGGLNGYSMDIAVDPAWERTCGWPGERPGVPLFLNAQTTLQEGLTWGINGDIRMRLFLMDLGPDRTLLVDIEAPDQTGWESLLQDAMPIVESFEFRR